MYAFASAQGGATKGSDMMLTGQTDTFEVACAGVVAAVAGVPAVLDAAVAGVPNP
jgi:hypothetical protein